MEKIYFFAQHMWHALQANVPLFYFKKINYGL